VTATVCVGWTVCVTVCVRVRASVGCRGGRRLCAAAFHAVESDGCVDEVVDVRLCVPSAAPPGPAPTAEPLFVCLS
jgi:hypothetical protein